MQDNNKWVFYYPKNFDSKLKNDLPEEVLYHNLQKIPGSMKEYSEAHWEKLSHYLKQSVPALLLTLLRDTCLFLEIFIIFNYTGTIPLGSRKFLLLPLLSSCGWTKNKIHKRYYGRRRNKFHAHGGPIEMGPEKWPKQAAFIDFTQRNNTVQGTNRTKKVGLGWSISEESKEPVWTWDSKGVTWFVYTGFLAWPSIFGDKGVLLPPDAGRAPFVWDGFPASKKTKRKSGCPSCIESESHSVVFDSLQPHGLYSPWNSPGQNTGVGSLSLLQEIFPTQGSNPGLLRCRQILYQLSHKGSPRILEWVVYPFSSGSSWPRNWTRVCCIADGFFTNLAIMEAPLALAISKVILIQKNQYVTEAHLGVAFSGLQKHEYIFCWKKMLNNIHSLLRSTHCSHLVFCVFCFVGKLFLLFSYRGCILCTLQPALLIWHFVLAYFPFRVCRSTLFSVITTFWFHWMGVSYFMDGFSSEWTFRLIFWSFVITPNAVCESYAQVKTNSLKQRRGFFEAKHIYTHLKF